MRFFVPTLIGCIAAVTIGLTIPTLFDVFAVSGASVSFWLMLAITICSALLWLACYREVWRALNQDSAPFADKR